MSKKKETFRFQKNDQIGAVSAEDDEFLKDCFVDTGDLKYLTDLKDHRHIIIGRTGTGKSALIMRLLVTKSDRVIKISPETLALTYISNSTILKFFTDLGVNLDPFFKLLWRHVFTVEILNHYFSKEEKKKESFIDQLKMKFCGSSLKEKEIQSAIKYLEEWGKEFWQETEFRVKEITEKFENDLKAELSGKVDLEAIAANTGFFLKEKLNEELRTELLTRGQDIVSRVQVKDLSKIIELLDSVLEDPQQPYYLIIDNLDENWVEDRIRYKLIMALILNLREFNKIRHVKLVIALRRDLIERVFRLTRDSGFQEEKYQSLYLHLSWNKNQILEILNRRINQLVKRSYTSKDVGYQDLLPRRINKIKIEDYIFQIAPRPRDVITFFNNCILVAEGKCNITLDNFRKAEGVYSRSRLRALGDEWSSNYPSLLDFSQILQNHPSSFKVDTIKDSDIEDLCLKVAIENPNGLGPLQQSAFQVTECILEAKNFKLTLIYIFYLVGLIGIKLNPHESKWQFGDMGRGISSGEVTPQTSIFINFPYQRALGIKIS